MAAEHGAAEAETTGDGTTEAETPLLTQLLVAGIVTGITIVGSLTATVAQAKSRFSANRPQPQLA
ncbi:MAG: hypothetical protein LBR79_04590 [Oscillospiraceae bacterium]|jgi:hypothetical protein|nr:hypothetical protein [Oscillospiraceae bacterium]